MAAERTRARWRRRGGDHVANELRRCWVVAADDNRRLAYRAVSQKCGLDFSDVHADAVDLGHVVRPSQVLETFVGVEPAQVASTVSTQTFGSFFFAEGGGRPVRVAPIAACEIAAADDDLSDLAGGNGDA